MVVCAELARHTASSGEENTDIPIILLMLLYRRLQDKAEVEKDPERNRPSTPDADDHLDCPG
jgi:hypothetical protein